MRLVRGLLIQVLAMLALLLPGSLARLAPADTRAWISRCLTRGATAQRRRGRNESALVLFRRALEIDPDPPAPLCIEAAQTALAQDRIDDAISLVERALQRVEDASTAMRVARFARKVPGQVVLTRDSQIGIVERDLGHVGLAEKAFRRALEIDPIHVEALRGLSSIRRALGDLTEAIDLLERAAKAAPGIAQVHYLLGRQRVTEASQVGAFAPESYHRARTAFATALNQRPQDRAPRHHLVRTYIREQRWMEAAKVSWFPLPTELSTLTDAILHLDQLFDRDPARMGTESPTVESVRAALHDIRGAGVTLPTDWLFVLHWRLVQLEQYPAAYIAKDLAAESREKEIRSRDTLGFRTRVELVQILGYLRRFDEAKELVQERYESTLSLRKRLALEALLADLSLVTGNAVPHAAKGFDWPSFPLMREAEARFRDLIRGRSVAVVGPAPLEGDEESEINEADVVVRTKALPSLPNATRVDIGYYATASAASFTDEVTEMLDSGRMQIAVLRTSMVDFRNRLGRLGDMVRYCPDEYRLHFRSSSFAIQRILYDVLRYSPSKVRLYGANFFTSERSHFDGYNRGSSDWFKARNLVKPMNFFPHDFLTDFLFTQRLCRSGLVVPSAPVSNVVSKSQESYLSSIVNPA